MNDDGSSYEFRTQALALSDETERARLEGEGWEIMPGTIPVVIYQLRRLVGALGARAGMGIDESKVFVLKASGEVKQYG